MMNERDVLLSMVLAWYRLGVTIDDFSFDVITGNLTIYISVPEHSYAKDKQGEEMSGMTLAKRVRETFIRTISQLVGYSYEAKVKVKTRKGEMWTKGKAEEAKAEGLDTVRYMKYFSIIDDANDGDENDDTEN